MSKKKSQTWEKSHKKWQNNEKKSHKKWQTSVKKTNTWGSKACKTQKQILWKHWNSRGKILGEQVQSSADSAISRVNSSEVKQRCECSQRYHFKSSKSKTA